jgi:predicted transcriptional regulator
MEMEEIMRSVLACFPGYSDNTLRAGDIILVQNVATKCKMSPMQARVLLNSLCEEGYLENKEATERKVAGYHLTLKGFQFYKKG